VTLKMTGIEKEKKTFTYSKRKKKKKKWVIGTEVLMWIVVYTVWVCFMMKNG
jgi:hypothetical protein